MRYLFLLFFSCLTAAEVTISSYNIGGLPGHYDYLRQAAMQKVMQERTLADPESITLNQKIQVLALKKLFGKTAEERALAQEEWEKKGYDKALQDLLKGDQWEALTNRTITPYKVRPVRFLDYGVNASVNEYLNMWLQTIDADIEPLVQEKRESLIRRIFTYYMKHDIVCFQEANFLDASMLPVHYQMTLSKNSDGVAWNRERFELIQEIPLQRGFAVKLLDKESGQTLIAASMHLSGCHPYLSEPDSKKGDQELAKNLKLLEGEADLILIGMDANVTALHPRLKLLKDSGYDLDDQFLEPTCTHPTLALDTRIDWIAVKGSTKSLQNIPVSNVGLNSIETNVSDHKPIGAKLVY